MSKDTSKKDLMKKENIKDIIDSTESDYELQLVFIWAELICENTTDRVRTLYISALIELQGQLAFYKKRGYYQKIPCGIAEKMGNQTVEKLYFLRGKLCTSDC